MSLPYQQKTRRMRRSAERAANQRTRHRPRPSRRPGLGRLTAVGLIGGIAVVALAVALGSQPARSIPVVSRVKVSQVPGDLAVDGFVLGRIDAPVTIDLYEDFQCPVCAAWGRNIFPSLSTNELTTGAARIVFHDMAFLGPESTDAGRAAYAALQQGRFWDMWATIYANQGDENSGAFSHDRLIAMADRLGLDVIRFESDMTSAAARTAIDRSRADARQAEVTATPTLVIGGQAFVGARPYAEIAAAISSAAAP
jgi:protein-disulfide isomerase